MDAPASRQRLRLCLTAVAVWFACSNVTLAQQVVGGMILPNGGVVTGPVFRSNGTFVSSITTGAEANSYLGFEPNSPTKSFADNLPAAVVSTTVTSQYVRGFTTGTDSRAVGTFIAPSNTIRGLTAQQIRDVLALPYLPDSLTVVQVPAGTCVLYGTAGPIMGNFAASPPNIPTAGPWGNGGGVQGKIIGITSDPNCRNAGFVPSTNYINQHLINGYALAYRPSAGRGNTYAVAAALDVGAFPDQFTDMDNIYNALDLLNVGSPVGLQAALKQLDGESYADLGFLRMMSARVFIEVMHQQMRGTRLRRTSVASAAAASAEAPMSLADPVSLAGDLADMANAFKGQQLASGGQRRGDTGGVWFAPYGSAGAVYGDSSTHSATYGLHGFAVGGDLRIADDLLVGMSLSYSSTAFSTSIPTNSGTNEAVSVAAYASYSPGAWYVDAALGYAYNWSSLSRTIVFPGVFRTAQGNPTANQFLGSIESGFAFPLNPRLALTPFGRFETTASTQNGFAETGGGAISLNAAAQTTTGVRTILGLQLSGTVSVIEPQDLALSVRAGWAHDYADQSGSLTANFLGKPDTSFTVMGPTPNRNAASVGASLNMALAFGQAFINYDGNFSQSYSTHAATVGFKVSF